MKHLPPSNEVSREQWLADREKENERAEHPCNDPNFRRCICEGACSCHWLPQKERP